MNIYEKLMHIQQNLKAPKNQYNKFGDFHYRSCEDIQEAVKPLLKEVKAVLLVQDEVIQIGSRFYIKATAAIQDTEGPGIIRNTAYAREGKEAEKTGITLDKVCERYKVKSVNELNKEQYARAMSAFKKTPSLAPPASEEQYALDFNGMENDMPFR